MKVRELADGSGYLVWCPACKHTHQFRKKMNDGKPGWNFNGDFEKPTFTPSMLERCGPFPDGRIEICHSFVREGKIEFLGDCTHSKAGQTLDLLDAPTPQDYGGIK